MQENGLIKKHSITAFGYSFAKIIPFVIRQAHDKISIYKIDFNHRQIAFPQLKTKGTYEETIITYPQSLMEELKAYIGDRKRGDFGHGSNLGNTFCPRSLEKGANSVTFFEKDLNHAGFRVCYSNW